MNFSLVICTYMRAEVLLKLLESVKHQVLYPDEIIIVDGSLNNDTKLSLEENTFKNLRYYQVDVSNRGLTKQRNYGIKKVHHTSDIICFLDDDTILEPNYFKELINTYSQNTDVIAVGGYITNEANWQKSDKKNKSSNFYYDGWMRSKPFRLKIRYWLGLQPDVKPGFLPSFAHGLSIGFIPPTDKIYPVEFFMGGASSYKRKLFDEITFSTYFEGYGLYEDLEFCLRASRIGKMYVNTSAKLSHYHEASGRPNQMSYGKMVVRNSWYVWKVKYPQPKFTANVKFYLLTFLLMTVRFLNVFNSDNKNQVLSEALGRFFGLISLLISKPQLK